MYLDLYSEEPGFSGFARTHSTVFPSLQSMWSSHRIRCAKDLLGTTARSPCSRSPPKNGREVMEVLSKSPSERIKALATCYEEKLLYLLKMRPESTEIWNLSQKLASSYL